MSKISSENYRKHSPSPSLDEKISDIKNIIGNTSELLVNYTEIGGIRSAVAGFEGMISAAQTSEMIMNPLMNATFPGGLSPQGLFAEISQKMLLTLDKAVSKDYGDIIKKLMSGFAVIMIDGVSDVISLGVQGYAVRSISEPSSEGNITGAHEGFVESVRTNMSLIRRRIKSPELRFKLFPVSSEGNTDVVIAYMKGRVPEKIVQDIQRRLKDIPLETLLGCGFPEPFLNDGRISVFSGVSITERPDVMCAKLIEGRAGIIIEGTPFALIVPALFSDNFQTLDDYNFKPYYATFIRLIRYAAFLLSVFLPGIYAAITMHHREILRKEFLTNLIAAEQTAPLPIAAEALIILIFYEVIREAGVRLPKSVGGAVSIIGGLVIGDTAVSAGVISNPILLVCAISVISGFVIPSLNQPVSVLRIICTAAGGLFGMYGTALIAAMITANICSLESWGVPVTSPVSPFTGYAMRDIFIRAGMKKLSERHFTVSDLNGADMDTPVSG